LIELGLDELTGSVEKPVADVTNGSKCPQIVLFLLSDGVATLAQQRCRGKRTDADDSQGQYAPPGEDGQ
jgi:hypothetical protein